MFKLKNRLIALLLAVFILLVVCGISAAYTETQLSTNKANQYNPSLYDKYITWTDTRNGGTDIYVTNMATKVQTRVTKSGKADYSSVAVNRIVYQDFRNGNWDIYMYDINTKKETRITTNKAQQEKPSIYGNKIVWEDYRNGNAEIYMIDLSTKKETRLTTSISTYSPSIFKDKVVWLDGARIVIYDLATKKKTTMQRYGYPSRPVISGTRIVWTESDSNGTHTIMYDFSTKKFIQLPFDYVQDPAFYGNKIVYTDWRSDNSDIFMAQF